MEQRTIPVGEILRQVREAHQLRQKELARRAGLHPGTISRIERGQVDPTYETLQKIAAAYQLTVPRLLSYLEPQVYSLELNAALDALRNLQYKLVKVEIHVKPL